MTADGEHLSGFFAWAFRDRAEQTIELGWRNFEKLAQRRGWKPKPVPTTPLDFTGEYPVSPGGLKLEVAVRDLPRGETTRPGSLEWQQCAYNLNWIILARREAEPFVTTKSERQEVPVSVLEKIALKTLKDCVRGQCDDWPKGSLRDGRLFTQLIERNGDILTMQISGYAVLSAQNRSIACQLHGRVVFDMKRERFNIFELVAAGQRSGRTQFNFRQNDLGPAPLGVAFTLPDTEK